MLGVLTLYYITFSYFILRLAIFLVKLSCFRRVSLRLCNIRLFYIKITLCSLGDFGGEVVIDLADSVDLADRNANKYFFTDKF